MDPVLMHFLLVAACWALAFTGLLAIAIGAVIDHTGETDRALARFAGDDTDPQVRP